MARTPAKIVTIVDVSSSMSSYGYITPAKSDADTFVNMFQPADRFAVLAFNDTAHRTYPTTNNLATFDDSTSVAASSAIQALRASGITNMGDAIIMGVDLLKAEAEPRGMVLLSDGEWNTGPDPLTVLDKNIRTYTIALGNQGQLDLLRKIAQETGGVYLFTPDAIGLASIYFDILEFSGVGQVVYNTLKREMVGDAYFHSVVRLSSGLDNASVAVNWADPSITYAASNPANNQVSVTVRDPNFKVVSLQPVYRDYGFVVYNLPNPQAGNWMFETHYVGSKVANITAGALDPDLQSVLSLEAPDEVCAGEPFTVRARLAHEGDPVGGGFVAGQAEVPSVSIPEAIDHHAAQLKRVELGDDIADTPEARMTWLRQKHLPCVDLLPRHTVGCQVRETAEGEHELTFSTDKPGVYQVRVEAVAPHPRGGELMRTRQLSVTVR